MRAVLIKLFIPIVAQIIVLQIQPFFPSESLAEDSEVYASANPFLLLYFLAPEERPVK